MQSKSKFFCLLVYVLGAVSIYATSSNPIIVDPATRQWAAHTYYDYNYLSLYKEIFILEDSTNSFSATELYKSPRLFGENNSLEIFNRQSRYWTKLNLRNNSDTLQKYYLEIGNEQINTWGDVHIYFFRADSLIRKEVTGIDIPLKHRTIRTAVNLVKLDLPPGITTLLISLDNHKLIHDDLSWKTRFGDITGHIAFNIYDSNSYYATDVYHFDGQFRTARRGHLFKHNYIKQCIEIAEDTHGVWTLRTVTQNWDEFSGNYYNTFPDNSKTYWMRFKIVDTDSRNSQLFGVNTGGLWNFDSIQVYTITPQSEYAQQLTGN